MLFILLNIITILSVKKLIRFSLQKKITLDNVLDIAVR